jgi:hypothetical protein
MSAVVNDQEVSGYGGEHCRVCDEICQLARFNAHLQHKTIALADGPKYWNKRYAVRETFEWFVDNVEQFGRFAENKFVQVPVIQGFSSVHHIARA